MMRGLTAPFGLALAACAALAATPEARADLRTPDNLVREIEAIELPQFDPSMKNDKVAVEKFVKRRTEAITRRADLIGELYKKSPDRPELTELLPQRWQSLVAADMTKAAAVTAEIDDVRAKSKDEHFKTEAGLLKALILLRATDDSEAQIKAVREFVKDDPKDPRAPRLLSAAADQSSDPAKQAELLKQVVADYPKSEAAGPARDDLKQLERVGKPFTIKFTDAINGTEISSETLKGKVVVVDFWATWCGPCVGEIPNMKKLYSEYKGKGVEFVGVSLDQPKEQGGLEKLKKYVAENNVRWPQYYLGNSFESEFSRSWDIRGIPAVFAIDAEGNLVTTKARGQLEKLIPELLKKAKKGDSAAGAH